MWKTKLSIYPGNRLVDEEDTLSRERQSSSVRYVFRMIAREQNGNLVVEETRCRIYKRRMYGCWMGHDDKEKRDKIGFMASG